MFGLRPAPEINHFDLDWFNVRQPLSLAALRGRLVILDFWTPCCVNCLHVLPVLSALEAAFDDGLVVIGVNSPKYPAERNPACVAHAIARLGIRHPVIHDPDLRLWHSYGVTAWPTLVFIGPDGGLVGRLQGEPNAERLLTGVGEMIRSWRRDGWLTPAPVARCEPAAAAERLAFPGKIKPLVRPGEDKCWVVADSGHHQVVVFDDSGRELSRFGSGEPGFADLDAAASAFNRPQGLVCDQRYIYVADTGNHAIRRIDLETRAVITLAGTGERGPLLQRPVAGRDVSLASVWDLEILERQLFFANAGTHQIGALDLVTGIVRPLAGCGGEDLIDGAAADAHLAQPTGLALDPTGGMLYFTDSETSAVRRVSLAPSPSVETLVGAGLFEFGCRDGDLPFARLQHCRGLAWWQNGLIVADTYNSALRRVDLHCQRVSRLADDGGNGSSDAIGLAGGEPAGVAADGPDRLLVADTNHHRILELRPSEHRARNWAA
jgi:thiol-disulfide isomerase/thioredoxin